MEKEKLKFRLLRADEIEVRIGQVNSAGVSLLLYKDARCDQNILDEKVGPTNWQRHHSRDNANCIVALWDDEKSQWIEKEDTGKESFTEAEKGLASDSFKRACFNWGIGRELYTAPKMFVFKDKLKNFKEKDKKFFCYDEFKVKAIEYAGDKISSVTISVLEKGKEYANFTFGNPTSSIATEEPAERPINTSSAACVSDMSDEDIVLIGNCKGKKYGDVKDTPAFNSFLKWVKNTTTSYPDPKQQKQYEFFRRN